MNAAPKLFYEKWLETDEGYRPLRVWMKIENNTIVDWDLVPGQRVTNETRSLLIDWIYDSAINEVQDGE